MLCISVNSVRTFLVGVPCPIIVFNGIWDQGMRIRLLEFYHFIVHEQGLLIHRDMAASQGGGRLSVDSALKGCVMS